MQKKLTVSGEWSPRCCCPGDVETGIVEVMHERSAMASLPRSFASSMLQSCDDDMEMSGFRKVRAMPSVTTRAEVLCRNAVQQSELGVSDYTQPQFAAVQVTRFTV